MADQYIEVEIFTPQEKYDIVIGVFSSIGFDSFWEKDESISAFILEEFFNKPLQEEITGMAEQHNFKFKIAELENKNWNAIWESNFKPVEVSDYCYVKADFHSSESNCKHIININPKMAFGTAHHETTYMMIEQMKDMDLVDKKVVDFGCGTAILAILAKMEKADPVIAFDYDEQAVLNSKENIDLNGVDGIQLFMGDIGDMGNQKEVDIILANINRQVLIESRDQMFQALVPNGELLMSGILKADYELIIDHYCEKQNFKLVQENSKGEWMCLLFKK